MHAAHSILRTFVLALAAILVAGCAGSGGTQRSETLEQRAQARWDLVTAGRYMDAYAYLTPGYRATKTVEAYIGEMSVRPVRWHSAAYQDHTCETEDACTVRVKVKFSMVVPVRGVGSVGGDQFVSERWIRLDGAWYHLPETAQ